jgi:hypothetical protein
VCFFFFFSTPPPPRAGTRTLSAARPRLRRWAFAYLCAAAEHAAAAAAACLPLLRNLSRYENTERRKAKVEALGLRYMGMGVSGGEEGARRGALLRRYITC